MKDVELPYIGVSDILGDPGAVSRNEVNRAEIVAEKVLYKSIISPGKRVSPGHFQASLRMLAPDRAKKKILCIILPNRRKVTSESLSCVLTRQFISISIREPQKSLGIISDVRMKYIISIII